MRPCHRPQLSKGVLHHMSSILSAWQGTVSDMPAFENLLVGIIIVSATAIVTHLLALLLRKYLRRDDTPLPSSSIFINIVRWAAWAIGISILLKVCFGLDASSIIAGLGIASIALSLGLQGTISNLFGGLQLSLMRLMQPGEWVTVNSITGIVRDVNWRHTTIETNDYERVLIPNSMFSNNALTHLPDSRFVSIPLIVPPTVQSAEFDERVLHGVRKATMNYAFPGAEPVLQYTGMTPDGLTAVITVTARRGKHADNEIRDAAIKAVIPLLSRAWIATPVTLMSDEEVAAATQLPPRKHSVRAANRRITGAHPRDRRTSTQSNPYGSPSDAIDRGLDVPARSLGGTGPLGHVGEEGGRRGGTAPNPPSAYGDASDSTTTAIHH